MEIMVCRLESRQRIDTLEMRLERPRFAGYRSQVANMARCEEISIMKQVERSHSDRVTGRIGIGLVDFLWRHVA